MSLTPGNCSSAARSWPARSVIAERLNRPHRPSARPRSPARRAAGAGRWPAPRTGAVGPVGEQLLVDVDGDQGHPAEAAGPRTTSGRPDITLSTVPPRSSTSSSLVTMTFGEPGRRDRLGRAGEGVERLQRRHLLLAGGHARQDRRQDAVAHRLPVGPDRDHQVAAPPDPVDQRLARACRRATGSPRGRRCPGRWSGPRRSHTSGRAAVRCCGSIRATTISSPAPRVDPRRLGPLLEAGQLRERLDALRLPHGQDHRLVGHQHHRRLRQHRLLRHAWPPAADRGRSSRIVRSGSREPGRT